MDLKDSLNMEANEAGLNVVLCMDDGSALEGGGGMSKSDKDREDG